MLNHLGLRSWRRLGMTLIELLVVLAILGVLMGLLLPAVQMARESARQTQCRNRLRQLGLASHQYHDSRRHLPMGCQEWRALPTQTTRRQWAWSARLLPFLEQGPVYEQVDFGKPFDHVDNQAAVGVKLPVFLCPDVPEEPQVGGRGRCDFGGLFGQQLFPGTLDDGTFLHETTVAFREIRDGLSQTLIVAEDARSPDGQWSNGRNVFVQAGRINDPTAWAGDNEIRSFHPGSALGLFGDAHVQAMADDTDPVVLAAWITRSGRELVEE